MTSTLTQRLAVPFHLDVGGVGNGSGGFAPQHRQLARHGNLVLYGPSNGVLWSTGTAGSGNDFAIQDDGNVVMYNPSGPPLWASNT